MTLEVAAFFRAGYANLISMTLKFECFSKFGHSQQIGGEKNKKMNLQLERNFLLFERNFPQPGAISNSLRIGAIYVKYTFTFPKIWPIYVRIPNIRNLKLHLKWKIEAFLIGSCQFS